MSLAVEEMLNEERVAVGRVEVTREVAATVEEVWRALTEPQVAALWFGSLTGELRVGLDTDLEFGDGDFFTLHTTRVEPPKLLQYTWRFLGIGPLDTVTWRLSPDGGGCVVTVTDTEDGRTAEAAAELREGWLDFTRRLKKFLEGGRPVRYAWRHEFDGSIELEGDGRLGELLFAEGRQAEWLPLSGPALADGAGFLAADGEEPGLLQVGRVRTSLPTGVRFELTHPDWSNPTACNLELTPRRGGALLSVKHAGWQAISRQKEYQKAQRKRFAALWISALRRARLLADTSARATG